MDAVFRAMLTPGIRSHTSSGRRTWRPLRHGRHNCAQYLGSLHRLCPSGRRSFPRLTVERIPYRRFLHGWGWDPKVEIGDEDLEEIIREHLEQHVDLTSTRWRWSTTRRRTSGFMGQVPPHPDQLKDETVARATTSRSVIRWTCSTGTPCSIEHVLPVTPRTFSS